MIQWPFNYNRRLPRDASLPSRSRVISLAALFSQIVEEKAWRQLNRRRGELIGKSRNPGLTAEEIKELDQLQAAVDQRLEPMDRQLLAAAEQFRQLAEGLPDATKP